MEDWADFYVATAGAAAALAGLLVVAVSINIKEIMNFALLPGRVAQTIIIIGAALVVASLGLMPHQPPLWFGVEALVASLLVLAMGALQLRTAIEHRKAGDPLTWTLVPLFMVAVAALPGFIGGVLLIAGNESGLYWIAAGVIASFVATLENGWVLLIEILR